MRQVVDTINKTFVVTHGTKTERKKGDWQNLMIQEIENLNIKNNNLNQKNNNPTMLNLIPIWDENTDDIISKITNILHSSLKNIDIYFIINDNDDNYQVAQKNNNIAKAILETITNKKQEIPEIIKQYKDKIQEIRSSNANINYTQIELESVDMSITRNYLFLWAIKDIMTRKKIQLKNININHDDVDSKFSPNALEIINQKLLAMKYLFTTPEIYSYGQSLEHSNAIYDLHNSFIIRHIIRFIIVDKFINFGTPTIFFNAGYFINNYRNILLEKHKRDEDSAMCKAIQTNNNTNMETIKTRIEERQRNTPAGFDANVLDNITKDNNSNNSSLINLLILDLKIKNNFTELKNSKIDFLILCQQYGLDLKNSIQLFQEIQSHGSKFKMHQFLYNLYKNQQHTIALKQLNMLINTNINKKELKYLENLTKIEIRNEKLRMRILLASINHLIKLRISSGCDLNVDQVSNLLNEKSKYIFLKNTWILDTINNLSKKHSNFSDIKKELKKLNNELFDESILNLKNEDIFQSKRLTYAFAKALRVFIINVNENQKKFPESYNFLIDLKTL